MSNQVTDDEYDEFFDDDEWEDTSEYERLSKEMPDGWIMIKLINYNQQTLKDLPEWLEQNCTGPFNKIGWYSNCAYSVAVQFEKKYDAAMFKLTFC